MAEENKKVPLWKCTEKCYYKGELYLEGDTVEDGDFSKHPCFEKIGEVVPKEKDETSDEKSNVNIPPANSKGSN